MNHFNWVFCEFLDVNIYTYFWFISILQQYFIYPVCLQCAVRMWVRKWQKKWQNITNVTPNYNKVYNKRDTNGHSVYMHFHHEFVTDMCKWMSPPPLRLMFSFLFLHCKILIKIMWTKRKHPTEYASQF